MSSNSSETRLASSTSGVTAVINERESSTASALLHHGPQPAVAKPLITGYRLLVSLITVTFGMSKAVLSYQGQSAAPTTLDWVFGVVITLG
jgi:hypothetical protein